MSATKAPRSSRAELRRARKVRVYLRGQASRVFRVWGVEASELYLQEGETDYRVTAGTLEVKEEDDSAGVVGFDGEVYTSPFFDWVPVGHVEGIEALG